MWCVSMRYHVHTKRREEGEQANEAQTFLLEYKASLCLQSPHANEKILPVFCCSSTKLASRALPIISLLSRSFAHQREPGRLSFEYLSRHQVPSSERVPRRPYLPTSLRMSVLPKESIKILAEQAGITNLSDEVAAAMVSDVEYRLREVIQVRQPRQRRQQPITTHHLEFSLTMLWVQYQESLKFMKHAKRSKLTTEDINDALRLRNVEVSTTNHSRTLYLDPSASLDRYPQRRRPIQHIHIYIAREFDTDSERYRSVLTM